MRLLVVPATWAYGMGPMTTCLGVTDAAAARGHKVAVLCGEGSADSFRRAGLQVFVAPDVPAPSYPPSSAYRLSDIVAAMGFADRDVLERTLIAEAEAISRFDSEAVFAYYQLTASMSARKAGIPVAFTVTWPDHKQFSSPLFDDVPTSNTATSVFNELLDENELPPVSDVGDLMFTYSDLRVVPTIPQVDPFVTSVCEARHVGHLSWKRLEMGSAPQWFGDWRSKKTPTVFVYFGPGDISQDMVLDVVPQALQGSGLRAVITTGMDTEIPRISTGSAVRVERAVPARRILQQSDLLICHGGHNILMNALAVGVPALVFACSDPERDFYARRLEELGAGLRCAQEDFTPAGVLERCQHVLSGDYGENARELGNLMQEFKGADDVVTLLEGMI